MNYKMLFIVTGFVIGVYAMQLNDVGNAPVHEVRVGADTHEDGELCSVCLGALVAQEMPIFELPECHHRFHRQCIFLWLIEHQTCPLCRAAVNVVALRLQDQYWDQLVAEQQERIARRNRIGRFVRVAVGTASLGAVAAAAYFIPWHARVYGGAAGQHGWTFGDLFVIGATSAFIGMVAVGTAITTSSSVPVVLGPLFHSYAYTHMIHNVWRNSSGLLDTAGNLVPHFYCFIQGELWGLIGTAGIAGLLWSLMGPAESFLVRESS